MGDLAKNMELFKESEGWKKIVEKLEESIDYRVKILTGEISAEVVDGDMNTVRYNKYDLLRLELNLLKGLREIPEDIIRYDSPIIAIQKD